MTQLGHEVFNEGGDEISILNPALVVGKVLREHKHVLDIILSEVLPLLTTRQQMVKHIQTTMGCTTGFLCTFSSTLTGRPSGLSKMRGVLPFMLSSFQKAMPIALSLLGHPLLCKIASFSSSALS